MNIYRRIAHVRELIRSKLSRETKIMLIIVLSSCTIGVLGLFYSPSLLVPGLPGNAGWATDEVEKLVKEGDAAFGAYRYSEAWSSYHEAERTLAQLIEFENDSPSRDITRLQHYHNAGMLLKARIELVAIAEDISRLEHPPPNAP